MRLFNNAVLRSIFDIKKNFSPGSKPGIKSFDGVEITPFRHDARAAVSISTDFELNWAWRGRLNSSACNFKGQTERVNIPQILRLLEEYAIPITWATVGHLFLSSCTRGSTGLAHEYMPRPLFNERWDGDWYVHDPCTDIHTDPLWYAPDLVQEILDSPVSHELGTHSFSHINFSTSHSDSELIRMELEESAKAMAPYGLRPKSLVFPYNKMDYSNMDVLFNCNIIAVRNRHNTIRMSYPERTDSGVYLIYESMNLRHPSFYDYLDKVKIFLEHAKDSQSSYHLWFHPSDGPELFRRELAAILKFISDEQHNGSVWVTTLADLAAYCEARHSTTIQVSRQMNRMTISFSSTIDTEKYGVPILTISIPIDSHPRATYLITDDQNSRTTSNVLNGRYAQNKVTFDVPSDVRQLVLLY